MDGTNEPTNQPPPPPDLPAQAADKPGKVLGLWDEKEFWWNAWQGNFPERANELEAKGGGPRRVCANVMISVVERFE